LRGRTGNGTPSRGGSKARLKVRELHQAIGFRFSHLHLVGSHHVDPENPLGRFK
jgi:hypothetical protein